MSSDLATFLQHVNEDGDVVRAAQVHVPTLVKMLRKCIIRHPPKRGHTYCLCGTCAHYKQLDRLAREAMEKRDG